MSSHSTSHTGYPIVREKKKESTPSRAKRVHAVLMVVLWVAYIKGVSLADRSVQITII